MTAPESAALEVFVRHNRLIREAIQQSLELKSLASEEERLAETVKEVGENQSKPLSRVFDHVSVWDCLLCSASAEPQLWALPMLS